MHGVIDPETGQNALVEDMTLYDEWVKWKMDKGAFYGLSLQPKLVTMESLNMMKAFQCVTLGASAQIRLKNMHKQLLLVARKQTLISIYSQYESGAYCDTYAPE